jgi:hypothetical protein
VVSLKIELTAATATNETMHNRINDCLPPNIQSLEMYQFVVVDWSFLKVLTVTMNMPGPNERTASKRSADSRVGSPN